MMMMMIKDRTFLCLKLSGLNFLSMRLIGWLVSTLIPWSVFAYSAATACNWGHLDKVDQSDYGKITIHSKKVCCGPIGNS